MMKNLSKAIIVGVVSCSSLYCGLGQAAEAEIPEFDLGNVVVTANRYAKRDVDTAAATIVLDQKALKNTGARNVQQALRVTHGVLSDSSRPGGGAINPASNSEIVMRGISGTLVLVNGVPLNLNNRYNLNDIPLEDVEKVEIVKGGGSVLYGSEGVGGVINIITKKTRTNSVKVGFGNYGQQSYAANVQAGKLGVGYSLEKWGNVDHTSDYNGKYNDTKGSENNNIMLNYQFDDKWNFMYNHSLEMSKTNYMGPDSVTKENEIYNGRTYHVKKDFALLQYQDDSVKGSLYYNYGDIDYDNTTYRSSSGKLNKTPKYANTLEKNSVYGLELQKSWDIGRDKLLFGTDIKHEKFIPDDNASDYIDYARNIYSFFGQWENVMNDKNSFVLSGRETWTGSAPKGKNYSNFSAQGQYIYKLDEDQSLYASVGQSFKMPTFKQTFGRADGKFEGNESVKPEKGKHYEIGWKKDVNAHKWRAAFFHDDVDDNISVVTKMGGATDTSQYTYTNEQLKNTGIEISCNIDKGEGMFYSYGMTFQNPVVKSEDSVEGVVSSSDWTRKYGRWQLKGGIGYHKDKWSAALNATYLADRHMLSSSSSSATKPYLLTSLDVSYAMDKRQELNLSIDNILDRQDSVGHTGTYYYETPINFLLSYTYKF